MLKIIRAKEFFLGVKLKRFTKRKEETKEINRLHEIFKTEGQIEEFWKAIERAEDDIKNGRVYTQKEMDEYYKEKFGIQLWNNLY